MKFVLELVEEGALMWRLTLFYCKTTWPPIKPCNPNAGVGHGMKNHNHMVINPVLHESQPITWPSGYVALLLLIMGVGFMPCNNVVPIH